MIAIILATYNAEPYLREQLDSLFQNTCQDWKLYLFDDGSVDATLEIAKEYEAIYPGRIQIRCNRVNLRSARNFYAGLYEVAKQEPADYYMFCDQDDRWDIDKIEVTLNEMKRLEQELSTDTPLLVYTDSRMVDAKGTLLAASFQKSSRYRSSQCDFAHLLMENKMPGCTEFMNASLVRKAFESSHDGGASHDDSFFPEYMKMHDWWFGLVAACFGKVVFLDRATMDYRQHGHNVVGGTGFLSYIRNRLSSLTDLRGLLHQDIRQGESFLERFGAEMEPGKRQVLEQFCMLRTAGFWKKRQILMRYPFRKSGLIRNLVLFCIL